MNNFCGLDFGTSNSTIGIYRNNVCQLVPLENDKATIRSAIFCDTEMKQWIFGQDGINSYLQGMPGRLMMSLKSVLGSSLMDDKTVIFNEFIPYSKVLSHFIHHIKARAEQTVGSEISHVVLGRPVHFHDNDTIKDQQAQNTLEAIARDLGFKEISFQYEPIAAALTYETSIQCEQLALIIDMGGGTSDFTIIRLRPKIKAIERSQDVLANCGIHIAGTDFDRKLSIKSVMPLLGMGSLMRGSSSDIEVPSMFYHDLTTWHTLSNLYGTSNIAQIQSIQAMAYDKQRIARLMHVLNTKAGHHILDAVETGKQRLSDVAAEVLDLAFIEANLAITLQRSHFNAIISDYLQRIIETICQTVNLPV